MLGAIGAKPLRQFTFGGNQQCLVRKLRRLGDERFEHLDLRGTVRDMILAANDVRNAKIDVINDARQQVEPAAVLPSHDRIAEKLGVELLLAADEVLKNDLG